MADWIEQYCAALEARDEQEQAHKPYIDAFTKLADQSSSQKAEAAVSPPIQPQKPTSTRKDSTGTTVSKLRSGNSTKQPEQPIDTLTRLRADLAITQKARGQLQAQVDELSTSILALQAKDKASSTQILDLSKQRQLLERRVRDREEELRGKQKLVQGAQDDLVALELQLNMVEERNRKLVEENKDLVDRWMKRMGEEADRVNVESRWS